MQNVISHFALVALLAMTDDFLERSSTLSSLVSGHIRQPTPSHCLELGSVTAQWGSGQASYRAAMDLENATSRFSNMDPVVGRIKRFKESINRYYQRRGETCVLQDSRR